MNRLESFFRKKPKLAPLAVGLVLALLSLLALLERLHTANEPWFCDVNFYASMGSEMNQGRELYSDLWDDRPPATYVTFAWAEKILGPGPHLILWMGFWASVAILLGLYAAGKGLSGKTSGGLWAAGLWALLSCEATLEAYQPNTEFFMNACLVGALALLAWRWREKTPWWAYALTGVLWAWAALYKQFMAVEALGLGVVYCLAADKKERGRAIKGIALAWGLALGIGAGTFAYFNLTGRGAIFYDTLFTYGRYYSGNIMGNLFRALEPEFLFPPWLWFVAPLALLAFAAPILAYAEKPRWAWLYGTFLLLKFFEKALPGRFFRHHYYQLWIPALCLGAAWVLALMRERFQGKKAWVAWATMALVVLFPAFHQAQWFSRLPQEWTWENYGRDYDGVNQVVHQVSMVLGPGEEFYEWAEYPRFYYASGRRVPVGVIFGEQTLKDFGTYAGGPLADELTRRTVADLEKNRPELVIWDKAWPPAGYENHPVNAYILSHYRAFSAFGPKGRFQFWCRIGGDLDGRLKGTGLPG